MKKIRLNSYPYVVNNSNYSTITFDLIFSYVYDKNHMFDVELFKQMVMNSSYDYKSEQEFKKEKNKRLIIKFNFIKKRMHNNLFIIFTITIPDPNKVENFDIEKAFEFCYNTIYKPNVVNNEFDKNNFEREKEYTKFSIQNSLKKIYNYGYQRFLQHVDNVGDLKNNIYSNLDLIDKCTSKSSYDYYKEVILNNTPVVIVYGDVKKEFIENLYQKYFKNGKTEIIFDKDYVSYLSLSKDVNYIEETANYNQSALYMAYKIENMSEKDNTFFKLLCSILDSNETNLVFKKLRTENNLIYSYNFERYIRNGMFLIESYIDKNNKDKTISAINEIFDELNDIEFIKDCVSKIIKGIGYHLIEVKDEKYYILDEFIDELFEFNDSLEQLQQYYKELDINEFMKFLNRVKLDTVYFLRGEANETK